MARVHIKADTTMEIGKALPSSKAEKGCCVEVPKNSKELVRGTDDCAGEWTHAICWIDNPEYGNMMIIPSATSFQDAQSKAGRCGGAASTVTYYSYAVLACAPYIRCNL